MTNRAVHAFLILLAAASTAAAQTVKDFVEVENARANKLLGYGLVTGLNGNGDSPKGETARVLRNFLQNQNLPDTAVQDLNARNVAFVLVTSELAAFQKKGTRLDVTVSALGDCKSLHGGQLQLTDLRGPNGRQPDSPVYALASGPLVMRGDARKGNHTTGTVLAGAIVEKELEHNFVSEVLERVGDRTQRRKIFKLVLKKPDLTTASQLVFQINAVAVSGTGGRMEVATPLDGGSIQVRIPKVEEYKAVTGTPPEVDYEQQPVRWLDAILNKPVTFYTLEQAAVIINDATKTVSWTGEVKLRAGSVMVAVQAQAGRPSIVRSTDGQLLADFMEKAALILTEQQQIDVVKALHQAGLIKAEVRSQ